MKKIFLTFEYKLFISEKDKLLVLIRKKKINGLVVGNR